MVESSNTADNLNTTDMDIDTSFMSYDTSPSLETSTTNNEQYSTNTYSNNTVTPKRVSFRDALLYGANNAPIPINKNTNTNVRNLQPISKENSHISGKSTKITRDRADPQGLIMDPPNIHPVNRIDSTRTIASNELLKCNIQSNHVKNKEDAFFMENTRNINQHK